MTLTPGTRLGPYEILAAIGAGGMGEVYRAKDTKLNRDVALKILPDAFAADPDRRARFAREAQLLASLHHPNIAGIYGVEDSGDAHALAMEFVDGEDLSAIIARGRMPPAEALPVATGAFAVVVLRRMDGEGAFADPAAARREAERAVAEGGVLLVEREVAGGPCFEPVALRKVAP